MRSRSKQLGAYFLLGVLWVAGEPSGAVAESIVKDSSRILPDGERVLEQSVVVPAPLEEVWQAFTSSRGFSSWAAPVAAVDFRLGGSIEASYRLDARLGDPGNIRNEILAYLPHRMIAFRNTQVPPDIPFDAATFQRLHTVVLMEEVGSDKVRVTIAQPGYQPGEAYEGVYRHFERGNRWSLEKLRGRFESGPVDWSAVFGSGSSPSQP